MFRFLFATGVITLSVISCRSDEAKKNKNSIVFEQSTLRKVDFNYKIIPDAVFLYNFGRLLELPPLSKKYDNINIRIWIWGDTGYVININRKASKFDCSIIKFTEKIVDSSEYLLIVNEFKKINLKSGWTIFFKYIDKFKILALEGGKPLEYQTGFLSHSATVQFEINNKGSYRFYEYLEPSFYRYVDSASLTVFNFLNYLNFETGIQTYSPDDSLFQTPRK